jgi:hypothetical protein
MLLLSTERMLLLSTERAVLSAGIAFKFSPQFWLGGSSPMCHDRVGIKNPQGVIAIMLLGLSADFFPAAAFLTRSVHNPAKRVAICRELSRRRTVDPM